MEENITWHQSGLDLKNTAQSWGNVSEDSTLDGSSIVCDCLVGVVATAAGIATALAQRCDFVTHCQTSSCMPEPGNRMLIAEEEDAVAGVEK